MKKIGVLLTNSGTPDAPTVKAVRRYLKEFLSDKQIIQVPRCIWLPLLYGFILPVRPFRSAKLYQKIWLKDGSPLRLNMQNLAVGLQEALKTENIEIEVGMNYGTPSIDQALKNLRNKNVTKILAFPLYPQYSSTTTASSFRRIKQNLNDWQIKIDEMPDYADDSDYIHALATSVQAKWQQAKANHLLISFHGIPERYIDNGDPYQKRCERTAYLLSQTLQLTDDQWTLCFQSRFGYAKWLKPSTQDLFAELPKQGIKEIDVICPGFAVDCLETLEEIALRGKEIFFQSGGKALHYIPALNSSDTHVKTLAKLINSFI